ncbi:MAG: hypothetical protein QGG74_04385 [Phycisphaerales bacterium]|nr:hypothetical protein [Phycisphaerales bacterium]
MLASMVTAALMLLSAGEAADPPPTEVDAALRAIESAGADLHAFTAAVAYRKDDALLGSKEIRTGSMVYEATDAHPTRLAVGFDVRIVNRRRQEETKRIVFDGSWLVERDDAAKQFIKRQIVAPGDSADPMRLGGPFPLPIGQRRDEVLKRFAVVLLPGVPDTFVVPKPDDLHLVGLRLTPREGTVEAEDWSTIDLWYDGATWLPIGVVATERNGDTRRIRLTKLTRHESLPVAATALLSIDEPGEGWSVDVRPWTE